MEWFQQVQFVNSDPHSFWLEIILSSFCSSQWLKIKHSFFPPLGWPPKLFLIYHMWKIFQNILKNFNCLIFIRISDRIMECMFTTTILIAHLQIFEAKQIFNIGSNWFLTCNHEYWFTWWLTFQHRRRLCEINICSKSRLSSLYLRRVRMYYILDAGTDTIVMRSSPR